MKSDDLRSGMIGDKEVEMHQLTKLVWAIDIVRHTSDDTKELLEGWAVVINTSADEYKALAMFDEKVEEIKKVYKRTEDKGDERR